ncbi:hypothetical protein GMMP15_1780009 [Candidatus Magnetomoraceae bacterium gMMP-15]
MRLILLFFVIIIPINSFSEVNNVKPFALEQSKRQNKEVEERIYNIGKVMNDNKFLATCFFASIQYEEDKKIKNDKVIIMNFHTLKKAESINNIKIIFDKTNNKNAIILTGSEIEEHVVWYAQNDVVFITPPSDIISKFKFPLVIEKQSKDNGDESQNIDYYQLYVTIGYSNAKFGRAFSTLRGKYPINGLFDFNDNEQTLYVVNSDISPGSSGSPLLRRGKIKDNKVYGMVSFGLKVPQKEIYYIPPQLLISAYQSAKKNKKDTNYERLKYLDKDKNDFGDKFAKKSLNAEYYDLTEPFKDIWILSLDFNSPPLWEDDDEQKEKEIKVPSVNLSLGRLNYFYENWFYGLSGLVRYKKESVDIIDGEIDSYGLGVTLELGRNIDNYYKISCLGSAGVDWNNWEYKTLEKTKGDDWNRFFIAGIKGSWFISENFTLDIGLNHEWIAFDNNTNRSFNVSFGISYNFREFRDFF